MPQPDLQTLARSFADSITSVLNRTITDGLRLSAVVAPNGLVFVGYRLTKQQLVVDEAFHIQRGQGQQLFLSVFFKLQLDHERKYLTVGSSSFGVYESSDMTNSALFRYEYERDKADGFPEAHLHVRGNWNIGGAPSEKLHLPLGDRRFRPSLEDLIQFLIVEGGAKPRSDDWLSALEANRQVFYEQQVRALVRRNPEIAKSALADL
jgi:hypothetical protein